MTRLSERAELIEVLASTIPNAIDLDNHIQVSEYLVGIAPAAGYTLSEVSRDLDAIIDRATEMRADHEQALKHARAM